MFTIEKAFHEKILATESPEDRGRQYQELYTQVYRLQREGVQGESQEGSPANCARLVLTFQRELAGKSVLEVGCGTGLFLDRLAAMLPHGHVCGLDTSEVTLPQGHAAIRFLRKDIVSFQLERRFDVVYSHQVLEHIAPADIPTHLASVYAALRTRRKIIVILPNKFWGPQDITRIVDNTYSGRVPAQGSHLNESSYTELEPQLEAYGFRNVRTILPFAHYSPLLRGVAASDPAEPFHRTARRCTPDCQLRSKEQPPVFKNPVVLIAEIANPCAASLASRTPP